MLALSGDSWYYYSSSDFCIYILARCRGFSLHESLLHGTERFELGAIMDIEDIVVDDEFRSLIPPLQDEERMQLQTNILADGCREVGRRSSG